MTFSRGTVFQLFKYAVYTLLAMNIYWFGAEEYLATKVQFPDGVPLADWIAAYSSTIDTFAWVILLLMFELETYVLEDRHFTAPVRWSLHGARFLCYAFIVYAFYGYIANVVFVSDTSILASIDSACALAAGQWSYATDIDEYVQILPANCAELSSASQFFRFGELDAIVDADGLRDIRYLAWVDVINAGVWLIIVVVLEIDVRLQEQNRFEGLAMKLSTSIKFVAYTILLLAAAYWGVKGDFVDFWDAFLWLVAFFFIEMNVIEWRNEVAAEHAGETAA